MYEIEQITNPDYIHLAYEWLGKTGQLSKYFAEAK